MGFSVKQMAALRRNVDARHVRTRAINGRELSYLEGWYAISAANRIFGFDGWSRETIETKCVLARENRGAFLAVYTAKVRITVLAEGTHVIREGHGTGEGRGASPGEAHDTALKAAETDATKRALITFGKPFGLELYRTSASLAADRRRADTGTADTRTGARLAAREDGTSLPARHDVEQPAYVSPEQVPAIAAESDQLAPDTSAALGNAIRSAEPSQTGQTKERALPRFEDAKPHPDDGTPIPRPSTHFGLENYLATRAERGALIEAAAHEARASEQQMSWARPAAHSEHHDRSKASNRIDKSILALPESKRLRDKNHLKYVASHPCLICGRQPADPHHLRFAQPRAIGMKVSDEFTVPLCRSHHRNLHQAGNELRWWENFRIEPMPIARKLWEETRRKS